MFPKKEAKYICNILDYVFLNISVSAAIFALSFSGVCTQVEQNVRA